MNPLIAKKGLINTLAKGESGIRTLFRFDQELKE